MGNRSDTQSGSDASCRSRPDRFVGRPPGSSAGRDDFRTGGRPQRALLYNSAENLRNSSERTLHSGRFGCSSQVACMGDVVFRRESAVEYFKELVEVALSHQRLNTQELTAYYVVQLLASFLQRPLSDDRADASPLAVRLVQALESGGSHQRASLKEIGDVAL